MIIYTFTIIISVKYSTTHQYNIDIMRLLVLQIPLRYPRTDTILIRLLFETLALDSLTLCDPVRKDFKNEGDVILR